MKILKYYDTVFSAEVARGRLESEGIMAIIQNESLGDIFPLGGVIQSFKPYIVVSDEDAAQAAEILNIVPDEPQVLRVCPECGSSDIAAKTKYKDDGFNLKTFRRIIAPLFLFGVTHSGKVCRDYYCRQCKHRF